MSALATEFDWHLLQGDDRYGLTAQNTTAAQAVEPIKIEWDAQTIEKIFVLRNELLKSCVKLGLFFQLVIFALVVQNFTPYWILGFLIFLPIALRHFSHTLTIYIALRRATLRNGNAA